MKKDPMEALKRQTREYMEKYGFYTHYVPDELDVPYGFNIHTHGVFESFGHFDLQICLAIPMNSATMLMHNVVEEIQKGKRFGVGVAYDKIAKGYAVRFAYAKEMGRTVLRMIFPDDKGDFSGALKAQWGGTTETIDGSKQIN